MLASIIFSVFYLSSSYGSLVNWYMHINGCFYKSTTWAQSFFTLKVKAEGNIVCIAAIICSVISLIQLLKHIFKRQSITPARKTLRLLARDLGYVVIAILCCVCAWWWGRSLVAPSFDEVFSAQNCAGIHPFQTVSYYMLPNNHIFFNLLNSVLFHFEHNKIASGRLISLVAYLGIVITTYWYAKKMMGNGLFAFLSCITISLQFTTWGFAFQARGYELYTLSELWMVISLMEYVMQGPKGWLYLNVLCCVVGYFCIPSFLYFHAAQLTFMLALHLGNRQNNTSFWKSQLWVLVIVFLLYLPALGFSGIDVLIHNKYVQSLSDKPGGFPHDLTPYFSWLISFSFSDIVAHEHVLNAILFLAPLLLLGFYKNRTNMMLVGFYIALWVSFIFIMYGMERLPFERNLAGHFNITLLLLIWTVYLVTAIPKRYLKTNMVQAILFPLFLIYLSLHFIVENKKRVSEYLYGYNVNYMNSAITEKMRNIPAGSSVSFSDESFYWYYVCKKEGYQVSQCPNGDEAYFIKTEVEPMPPLLLNRYVFIGGIFDYQIYQRK